MKKKYLSVALVLTLAASISLSSCIGSFALTKKVMSWNRQVGDKFVNELVFVALWILPVYELTALADITVFNSIEFWSGENPMLAKAKVIDGKDAKYLVENDANGYTITNLSDNSKTRLNFDKETKGWSIEANGKEHLLFTYVDSTHVNIIAPNGTYKTVELSAEGLWAYEQEALDYFKTNDNAGA